MKVFQMTLRRAQGETGIDGVFVKDGQYYIVEVKYHGQATLGMTQDGKQMSDRWIQNSDRILKAVGENESLKNQILNGYKRILAEVAPDGTIVYKELDTMAKEIGIFVP